MSGGDKQIASVSYWLVKVKQCEQGGGGGVGGLGGVGGGVRGEKTLHLHPSHSLFPWRPNKDAWEAGGEGEDDAERWLSFETSNLQSPVQMAITRRRQQTPVCMGRVWLAALV